jgi:hypothetical protein
MLPLETHKGRESEKSILWLPKNALKEKKTSVLNIQY